MSHTLRVAFPALLLLTAAPALAEGSLAVMDCATQACTCNASGTGAQCPLHRHGKRAQPAVPAFDASRVTTVRGTVVNVERVDHGGVAQGVLLTLDTDAGKLAVHLGPSSFVDPKMTFAAKDVVEVRGSRVDASGTPSLLATQVKKNGQALELRKADGTPLFFVAGRQ